MDAAAIEGSARHLLELADHVADLVASASGPPALHVEEVALAPLLQEAIAAIDAQLGPGERRWRIAPAIATVRLQADPRALLGALRHALARAARLSRHGDWIELRLVVAGETLALVVEDEGVGKPAADLAADVRATSPAAAGTRGIDLGLAVARKLLRAHGGDLTVEATPGIGTRAWLTLPLARATGLPASA